MQILRVLPFVLAFVGAAMPSVRAADDLAPAIHRIQTKWETIKFTVPEGDKQTEQMNALGGEADALAEANPTHVEALIWDGIITSERASMANPLTALGLAKRARDILEKAYKMDPAALDAGAPTSLGVLYYRVPGFPIGFGDTKKARQLLDQATRTAPNGLDAWYFYGDFLVAQKDYPKAAEVLEHALKLPAHPERPLWDKNRRLVIEELLAKIPSKS
jgi:tetratricopeptide (TPR) repeat protein